MLSRDRTRRKNEYFRALSGNIILPCSGKCQREVYAESAGIMRDQPNFVRFVSKCHAGLFLVVFVLFCFVLGFFGGGGICFCLLVGTFVFACLLAHSKRMSFSSGVVGPPPPPHEFTKLNLAQGANFCQANIWSATERPPVLCKI